MVTIHGKGLAILLNVINRIKLFNEEYNCFHTHQIMNSSFQMAFGNITYKLIPNESSVKKYKPKH